MIDNKNRKINKPIRAFSISWFLDRKNHNYYTSLERTIILRVLSTCKLRLCYSLYSVYCFLWNVYYLRGHTSCIFIKISKTCGNKNVSIVYRCHLGTIFAKFRVDWTSTSSKTTSTKNLNLKRDRRRDVTNERTNTRMYRLENIMHINGA